MILATIAAGPTTAQQSKSPPPAPTPPPTTGVTPGAGGATPLQVPPGEIRRFQSGPIPTGSIPGPTKGGVMAIDVRAQTREFQTFVLSPSMLTEIARSAVNGRVETVHQTVWNGFVAPEGYEKLTAKGVIVNWSNPTARVKSAAYARRPIDVAPFNVSAFTPQTATALLAGRFDVTFTASDNRGGASGSGPSAEVARLRAAGILDPESGAATSSGRKGIDRGSQTNTDKTGAGGRTPGLGPQSLGPPIAPAQTDDQRPFLREPDRVITDRPVQVDPKDIPKYHDKKKKE